MNNNFIIGKHILDILTSGMYNNPLMILREYIQNAADSIDLINSQGSIEIDVDGNSRTISILDNGVGVSNQEVERDLHSIGCSKKDIFNNRGFRGIGRLGGLGYCEKLLFETRSNINEKVAIVEWGSKDNIKKENIKDLYELIFNSVKISFREPFENELPNFFKVRMININRFHKDILMDIKSIKNYLSQVAPVSFNNNEFPFAKEINNKLCNINGFKTYKLKLNKTEVFKPHSIKIKNDNKIIDEISNIEWFDFKNENNNLFGLGWYANTSFFASLPSNVLMRGLKVRQGNIEIGNEYFLADYFTERRFSTWHIGEIHLSNGIKPNARRDGFENSKEYEMFSEQVNIICNKLSHLCRESSKIRSKKIIIESKLNEIDNFISNTMLIDKNIYTDLLEKTLNKIETIENQIKNSNDGKYYLRRLNLSKKKLQYIMDNPPYMEKYIDGRTLNKKNGKEILNDICINILKSKKIKNNKEEIVKDILKPYLK